VKTIAVIQARMGSSRLPGKMLMPLAGRPVIRHVYDRARMIAGLDDVLVATTVAPGDDPLADYCEKHGMAVFRGSEEDVLDRFVQAGRQSGADVVMRLTGDCPLLDPAKSAMVLDAFRACEGCEYAGNIEPPYLPDGLDTEVVALAVLERIRQSVDDTRWREHVTLYIREHPDRFKLVNVREDGDYSDQRWTLDHAEDMTMLAAVMEELGRRGQFGYFKEVLAVVSDHPEFTAANRSIERNEAIKQ